MTTGVPIARRKMPARSAAQPQRAILKEDIPNDPHKEIGLDDEYRPGCPSKRNATQTERREPMIKVG